LSHSSSPIFVKGFQNRVSQTICPGWLQTSILLISASWVARITGMRQWRLAFVIFKFVKKLKNFRKKLMKSKTVTKNSEKSNEIILTWRSKIFF
jgi:hypothetical protein